MAKGDIDFDHSRRSTPSPGEPVVVSYLALCPGELPLALDDVIADQWYRIPRPRG